MSKTAAPSLRQYHGILVQNILVNLWASQDHLCCDNSKVHFGKKTGSMLFDNSLLFAC